MKLYRGLIIGICSLIVVANVLMVGYVANEEKFNKEPKTYIVEKEKEKGILYSFFNILDAISNISWDAK